MFSHRIYRIAVSAAASPEHEKQNPTIGKFVIRDEPPVGDHFYRYVALDVSNAHAVRSLLDTKSSRAVIVYHTYESYVEATPVLLTHRQYHLLLAEVAIDLSDWPTIAGASEPESL